MKSYAGIGSRDISRETFGLLSKIGNFLYHEGYCLNSGFAIGSDTAFYYGAYKDMVEPDLTKIKNFRPDSDLKNTSLINDFNINPFETERQLSLIHI